MHISLLELFVRRRWKRKRKFYLTLVSKQSRQQCLTVYTRAEFIDPDVSKLCFIHFKESNYKNNSQAEFMLYNSKLHLLLKVYFILIVNFSMTIVENTNTFGVLRDACTVATTV